MKWRLEINEAHPIPEGYGIAMYQGIGYGTYEFAGKAVCYRVPLNLIVGLWRAFLWSLVCPPWRFVEYKRCRAEYQRGVVDGWRLHGGSPETAPYGGPRGASPNHQALERAGS